MVIYSIYLFYNIDINHVIGDLFNNTYNKMFVVFLITLVHYKIYNNCNIKIYLFCNTKDSNFLIYIIPVF